jgi:hypothetical protein
MGTFKVLRDEHVGYCSKCGAPAYRRVLDSAFEVRTEHWCDCSFHSDIKQKRVVVEPA